MSLLWSSHKLLEQDEIFSLQTDRVSSFAEVLRIQRSYPISLEPPPYHLLAHAAMRVFGPAAFALRLPAFLGYLLMQLCLYFFVRNLVGRGAVAVRAGLIAMAVPALTWTLYYSAEGRPYGLLLGSYALAALCWQVAAGRAAHRLLPLIGLALALALTLNLHFYGVLLLLPICGAEAVRTFDRRRLDWGMLAAIVAGIASLAAALPYVSSSGEFKRHYYAGPVSAHMLTQPYRQMLLDYTAYARPVQTMLVLLLVVVAATVALACLRVARSGQLAATRPEWVLVLLLVALPVFAFVLGKFVTHALEVRHSIGAMVGIAVLAAVAAVPRLRSDGAFHAVMVLLWVGIVGINALHVRQSAAETRRTLADLTLSTQMQDQRATVADHNLYFQNLGQWETASLYEPDPALRSHLVLVYSRDDEMRYEQHDTMFLTATHTQRFSSQPVIPFSRLLQSPGEHIFVVYHSGWDWAPEAFRDRHAQTQRLGSGFGGDLIKVRFQP
jgi:hypothetical protein